MKSNQSLEISIACMKFQTRRCCARRFLPNSVVRAVLTFEVSCWNQFGLAMCLAKVGCKQHNQNGHMLIVRSFFSKNNPSMFDLFCPKEVG